MCCRTKTKRGAKALEPFARADLVAYTRPRNVKRISDYENSGDTYLTMRGKDLLKIFTTENLCGIIRDQTVEMSIRLRQK